MEDPIMPEYEAERLGVDLAREEAVRQTVAAFAWLLAGVLFVGTFAAVVVLAGRAADAEPRWER